MEKLGTNTNALNWFEIPVTDVNRAKAFYETIFDVQMHQIEMMGNEMILFPPVAPNSGGALVKSSNHHPSAQGSIIYLNGNPNLQTVVDRIEAAGGKIAMPKMVISPETGSMAMFVDTEGNLVGLHSVN